MGLSERLRRLDNQVLGEPLPREAALAVLVTRRPRYSTRFGAVACIAAVAFAVGVSGVFSASTGRLAGAAVVAVIFGWLALRMRRVERETLAATAPGTAHQLPPPPRLGWLQPSFLAAALGGLGIARILRQDTAHGVADLVLAALCVTWAGVRFVRWRRSERERR